MSVKLHVSPRKSTSKIENSNQEYNLWLDFNLWLCLSINYMSGFSAFVFNLSKPGNILFNIDQCQIQMEVVCSAQDHCHWQTIQLTGAC